MNAAVLLSLVLASTAPEPDDFAAHWPLVVEREGPAHAVALELPVYAELGDPSLRDLVVFNAAGRPVPSAFVAAPRVPTATRSARALHRLPRDPQSAADADVALRVSRDPDGQLRELELETRDLDAAPRLDGLIDLGSDAPEAVALDFTLTASADPLRARLRLRDGDDLEHWRELGAFTLARLSSEGFALHRTRFLLPRSPGRYLLVEAERSSALQHIAGVVVETRRDPVAPLRWIEFEGRADAEGWTHFELPGPLPVAELDVGFPEPNTVARVTVESRAGRRADEGWTPRAQIVAYALDAPDALRSEPVEVGLLRDRHWRLRATPPAPMKLRVGWRPDTLAFLAQGEAPFRLAAGSARARREDAPLETVLSSLRARHGGHYMPPTVALGERVEVAGAAAREQREPLPWRRVSLWLVLIGGAAAIAWMVLRLLREQATSERE